MALGTAGPGNELIFRANEEYLLSYFPNEEYLLSYFPLKLLCITVVFAFSSLYHTGTLQKTFCMGSVGLNLHESA